MKKHQRFVSIGNAYFIHRRVYEETSDGLGQSEYKCDCLVAYFAHMRVNLETIDALGCY